MLAHFIVFLTLFSLNFFNLDGACSNDTYACVSWAGIFTPDPRDACQPLAFVCDGRADCPLGDDEWNCDNCTTKTGFVCNTTKTCIDSKYECDGVWDCPNQEDEDHHCGTCNSITQWSCTSTGRCINITQLCDGNIDCLNGEDEILFNCNATSGSKIEKVYVYVGHDNNNNVNTITIIFIVLVSILIVLLLCFMYLFLRYYIQTKSLEDQLINTNSNIMIVPTEISSKEEALGGVIISPRSKSKLNNNNNNNNNNILSPKSYNNNTPKPKKLITPRGVVVATPKSNAGRRTPISLAPILTNIMNTPRNDGYHPMARQQTEDTEHEDYQSYNHHNHDQVEYGHVIVDKLSPNHHNHNIRGNNVNIEQDEDDQHNDHDDDDDDDDDDNDNDQQQNRMEQEELIEQKHPRSPVRNSAETSL